MLKSKVWRQLLPVLFFLALISIIQWPLKFSLTFFWLGAILGNFLLDLDQMIYCYFQSPHEFGCQRVKRLFDQKRWTEGARLLIETQEERRRLMFHSILFQIVLLVVCFFVLSSSASLLGKGLVLGLFFRSLYEQAESLLGRGQMDSWFWQFRTVPQKRVQVFYFLLMLLFFISFSLLLV